MKIVEQLIPLARDITEFTLDPANARKHNRKNLDAIKYSLKKFGQRKPIVVQRDGDTLTVRAGNGTLAAALELGAKQIAAVIVDEDNASATAYGILDNRSAELAEWDEEVLPKLLDGLDDDDWDLTELGFEPDDINKFEFEEPSDEEKDPIKELTLRISFEDEDEQQALFCELRDRGFKVKT